MAGSGSSRRLSLAELRAIRRKSYQASASYSPSHQWVHRRFKGSSVHSAKCSKIAIADLNVAQTPQSVYPDSSVVLSVAERATAKVTTWECTRPAAAREKAARLAKRK